MSNYRKGIQQPPQPPSKEPTHSKVVGRSFDTRPGPPQPPIQRERRVISSPTGRETETPYRVGVLLGADGKVVSQPAQEEQHTGPLELCTRCGKQGVLKTVIANAENPNNPLRICDECADTSYKDPYDDSKQWRPSVPNVRFDRRTAAPYDAHRAGVKMSDLVNRDTYHRESEASEYGINVFDTPAQEGQWSGGGRVGHAPRGAPRRK